MILYFADRQMNILGHASTNLPEGLTVIDDLRTEDVSLAGVIFECKIPYDDKTRKKVADCTEVGNYILYNYGGKTELYSIIETEADTKNQTVYIYAEDAGMDLLNEVVGAYEAEQAYPISHYIDKYASNSGFQIGINEVASLTRKLSWDGEATAQERILSVAAGFDNCELSFSFDVDGLYITNKYINIYKKRGKDIGATLRLNKELDSIETIKSIANLATALQCVGSTPEAVQDEETGESEEQPPVTLEGYAYDDGDFYVDGAVLKSRQALKTWARLLWKADGTQKAGGHITKQFSYDTLSQSELCNRAISELKKLREMEVNYEVEISTLPENIKAGDQVSVIDDAGELYLSTRILTLETSVANKTNKAVLGEYLIKNSGISQKVEELAAGFAKNSQSAARALDIAKNAKAAADSALEQVDDAMASVEEAKAAVDEVIDVVDEAKQAATEAQTAANNAQTVVDNVESDILALETSVANAQAAADQARAAADAADELALEARLAALNAQNDANAATEAATTAGTKADSATTKATAAESAATQAIADAEAAATEAAAAKLDAENAQKDIDYLGENLTTLSNTMQADYARKTDLTETTASLQTQITQNAAEISSTATRVQEIDETANNAATKADAAQTAAEAAQSKADQATADAETAQTAANAAATAAANAQSEADTAKAAAETAQSVADKAEADLEAAKADLVTVQGRVDATEEEITAAQNAVTAAQSAADKAQADADEAAAKAATAQNTANTAVTDAANAQSAADDAASKATLAQQTADAAKGDAATAQAKADEAAQAATAAQQTANTAVANAATAQSQADAAVATAAAAQQAADDADAKAAAAQSDLDTAKQNLANVTSRVDATEEEVAAAQAAVETAQAAADTAKAEAEAAQSTADTAKANAATAQTAADNAKTAADNAQADADAAKAAADAAQADVDALAVRVTTAETSITQNAEQIALRATKTEVAETLGGYYTKAEADSAISVKANEITQSVSSTYATKNEVAENVDAIEIGGRNLAALSVVVENARSNDTCVLNGYTWHFEKTEAATGLYIPAEVFEVGSTYVLSFKFQKTSGVLESVGGHCAGFEQKRFLVDSSASATTYAVGAAMTDDTETHEVECVLTFNGDVADNNLYIQINRRVETEVGFDIWDVMLEKGNKATKWTPAPEDVDDDIKATDDGWRQAIEEQNTSITQNCEAIIIAALDSYVETGDYDSFKETVETQLSILSDQITMNFTTTTEQISAVDGDLQSKFTQLYTHIAFSGGGITISESTGLSLALAGGCISFKRNGVQFGLWDGVNFYTGNIVVQVNERAQFGNFAFIPRSDGSLMLLKVGE